MLILKFMGWESYNAYEILDMWECSDGLGGKQYSDIFVLNPTDLFLKHKAFGFNNEYGVFEDKKLYDDWEYNLSYHLDWNLLMPVVEKIQHLDNQYKVCVDFKIELMGSVELWIDHKRIFGMSAFEEGTLINAVYQAVVEFIKWYNEKR